jgi:aryl-alcohol dehydrogenase-like predicted oxidoreductase
MQYRFLGNTGLRVSALSLGGWVTYGGQVGEDLALKCMEEAWKNGINFFDSAEVYAEGKCEVAMGKAIKKLGWKREDFVMSTKLFWGAVLTFQITLTDLEPPISQSDRIEPKAFA